jgi:D-psicose/D-tagatose/L-ribulose 3-epimerase
MTTAADGVKICQAIGSPRVGLLFDTFHANIEEKDVAVALRTAGPHVKHIHTCENDRGVPGTGHVPWANVAASAKAIGYDDWLVIESFGSRIPEIAAAACVWRDFAPSAEAIAFDGVKFLRETFV